MAQFEQPRAGSSASANHELTLQMLARRLLAPRYPGVPTPEELQLLVGQLPDELPAELPLPEGARIVGSLVRGRESIEVVLDTGQSAGQVVDFYREHLTAAGWSELEYPGSPGGFVPAVSPVVFCQSPRGPSLSVAAHPVEEGFTDVRLSLHTGSERSPCRQPWTLARLRMPIPQLVAPPNTRQSGGGVSISDTAYGSAMLETELDSPTLMAHYATQLEQAGWTRRDAGRDGPVAWSIWAFQDETGQRWQGLMFVLEVPQMPDRRFVYVRADPVS